MLVASVSWRFVPIYQPLGQESKFNKNRLRICLRDWRTNPFLSEGIRRKFPPNCYMWQFWNTNVYGGKSVLFSIAQMFKRVLRLRYDRQTPHGFKQIYWIRAAVILLNNRNSFGSGKVKIQKYVTATQLLDSCFSLGGSVLNLLACTCRLSCQFLDLRWCYLRETASSYYTLPRTLKKMGNFPNWMLLFYNLRAKDCPFIDRSSVRLTFLPKAFDNCRVRSLISTIRMSRL